MQIEGYSEMHKYKKALSIAKSSVSVAAVISSAEKVKECEEPSAEDRQLDNIDVIDQSVEEIDGLLTEIKVE